MSNFRLGDRLTVFSLLPNSGQFLKPLHSFIGDDNGRFITGIWTLSRYRKDKFFPVSIVPSSAARPVATFVIKSLK